jgi:hypothetical protein
MGTGANVYARRRAAMSQTSTTDIHDQAVGTRREGKPCAHERPWDHPPVDYLDPMVRPGATMGPRAVDPRMCAHRPSRKDVRT